VAVGAVLTQNTAWVDVERAIGNLREAGALDARALLDLPEERLAALLRPAGYFNVKARRLRALVAFLADRAGGDPARLPTGDPDGLRRDLLAVPGVGRETADSILLYAVGLPSFVIDAYTRRLFGRLGLLDPDAAYDDLRAAFEAALPRDVALYNDFHAQIVAHGKHPCRPRPACPDCLFAAWCPAASGREAP
jgi:endonuclease-3 related protein